MRRTVRAASRSAPSRALLSLLAAALLAGPVGPTGAAAQPASGAKHMLWTVARDGSTVGYLVGSVHLMKPEVYPLPSAYDDAFGASDVIAFETDLDSAQARSQELVQRMGVYSGDKTLESQLPDSTYALLRSHADSLGIPLGRLQKFEPWVVSFVIPVIRMQQAGYSGQHGVDQHFFEKAKEAGKERVALETPAEQIGFFDGLPLARQAAFLEYSVRRSDRTVEVVDELAAAWSRGDVERVEAIMEGELEEDLPVLHRTLVVERNRAWMEDIIGLLESERRPMIVVGVGHLTGENGLAALLRGRGYTVEQQ